MVGRLISSPFGAALASGVLAFALWQGAASPGRSPAQISFLFWAAVVAILPAAMVAAFAALGVIGAVGRIPLVVAWWLALLLATMTAAMWCSAPLVLTVYAVRMATFTEASSESFWSNNGLMLVSLALGAFVACAWGLLVVYRVMTFAPEEKSIDRSTLCQVSDRMAPALFRLLKELCRELRVPVPAVVMLTRSLDFYVTRERGQEMLVLSAPALTLLTVPEFIGIVGHELSHLRSGDLVYSGTFMRLYRRFQLALGRFRELADVNHLFENAPGPLRVLLFPAVATASMGSLVAVQLLFAVVAFPISWSFSLAIGSFALLERHHSRRREFAADRLGARACGPAPFISGLVKMHAAAPLWNEYLHSAARDVDLRLGMSARVLAFNQTASLMDSLQLQERARYDPRGAATQLESLRHEYDALTALQRRAREELRTAVTLQGYAAHARARIGASLARALLQASQPHPLDSHPTLHHRLAAIAGGNMLNTVMVALQNSRLPERSTAPRARRVDQSGTGHDFIGGTLTSLAAIDLVGGMGIDARLPLHDSPF